MTISVIICTLSNYQGLHEVLSTICRQERKPDEIVIVHGERDDETKAIAMGWKARGLNIIYLRGPHSLVLQRNQGLGSATGDIVCFLDDDVILEEGYFASIARAYESDSAIGGVQGTIINNAEQRLAVRMFLKVFFFDNMYGGGTLKRSGSPSFHKPAPYPVEVEVFNGCLMTFRRSAIIQTRFDEWFSEAWLGDDFEASYNVSRHFRLLQIPDARLIHFGNACSSRSNKLAFMRGRNYGYVRHKHGLDKGFGKMICMWSDLGVIVYYLILAMKGEGWQYLAKWFLGKREYAKDIKRGY